MKSGTTVFKRTQVARAVITALCGTASLFIAQETLAQDQQNQGNLQRVEVTGSAIRRVDAETALPVTVLKTEELRQQGLTTVEEVVNTLAGNQSLSNTAGAVGAATGGASFANLRGLGANKTLVLLNGRRIANNAADSSAPDLNMIPLAAIERIEVLRDGASSLYGTDAIGGVINFVTKKDFRGGVASVQYSQPQHPGGKSSNINVGYGVGDLERDRFNIFGFLDLQKQDPITTQQRDFTKQQAASKTSGTGYPGSYTQANANGRFSVDAPACASQYEVASKTYCRYAYANYVDLIPKSERTSGLLRGTLNLGGDTRGSLEYFASQSKVWTNIAPVPYAALSVNPGTRYYPGAGIVPAPPAGSGIDPTLPLNVRWRDVPNGPRADRSDNKQQRLVAAFEGASGAWDWQSGLSYNENKITNYLTGGYTNGDIITPNVQNGTINPFTTTQDAAGQAALNSANVVGPLWFAKGKTVSLDGHASRELADWFNAGHKSAIAVGAEYRREQYHQNANASIASQVVSSSGFDPTLNNGGSRNVYAFYSELNVPVTQKLEVTGAVRYDHYSDFGSTFNPKLSARWQPLNALLFRGSVASGFRAPSLFDLYASPTFTNTANTWDDPVRCAGGTGPADACQQQFEALTGGNTKLKPEKSRTESLGFVVQPTPQFDFGLDFWWVTLNDQIGALTDTSVFSNPTKYAGQFKRAPDGSLSFDGTQCPGANCGYVLLNTQNLGGLKTDGVDLTTSYRWKLDSGASTVFRMSGTYVSKYEYQTEAGGQWFQGAGAYTGITTSSGGGPIVRWQYNASLTYVASNWSVGVANRFKRGYADQNGGRVGDWNVFDVYGSYSPIKSLTLTAGVRNVLDSPPPYSNQTATFQLGYDPRVADPFGRAYYVRGTYRF